MYLILYPKKSVTFGTHCVDLEIRKKLLKTYAWSVAFYGCEAWTIGKGERRRLEDFEMWCYRKLSKIIWVDKVTN